ncbi:MAG: hypothetical protein QOI54_2557 [Actinomycetota bacterium]|jgi:hypothetical protein|nr:hypothetical protein [Actinomycetota bacterium]
MDACDYPPDRGPSPTAFRGRPVTILVHVRSPRLHPTDRCDRCGMQAFVNVRLPSGRYLLWCRHHYAVHHRSLRAAGGVVTSDHRVRSSPIKVRRLA